MQTQLGQKKLKGGPIRIHLLGLKTEIGFGRGPANWESKHGVIFPFHNSIPDRLRLG